MLSAKEVAHRKEVNAKRAFSFKAHRDSADTHKYDDLPRRFINAKP
jgi:hypothetical protein